VESESVRSIIVEIWTKKRESLFLYSADAFIIIIVIITIIRSIITVVPLFSTVVNKDLTIKVKDNKTACQPLTKCPGIGQFLHVVYFCVYFCLFCSFLHTLQTRLADQACWDEGSLVMVCMLFTCVSTIFHLL